MLFLKPPTTAGDIRAFCARFSEGLRVEYKSTFDANVRRNLPKVVSSFANSLGGVLVIGVNTVNGTPQGPIEGFPDPSEELTLTVENICLQGLNPPIVPRVFVVPSDVQGKTFLVIEVEESWEAPHAIENNTTVYVRTGNAANPYDLAKVDLIIELTRRRLDPAEKLSKLLERARRRADVWVHPNSTQIDFSISPAYPRNQLCSREDVWNFMVNTIYRGAHYFASQTLRRVEDGIASVNRPDQYVRVGNYGLLFLRNFIPLRQRPGDNAQFMLSGDVLHPIAKLLHCSETFYRAVGYRGPVTLAAEIRNVQMQSMIFLRENQQVDLDNYRCLDNEVSVKTLDDTNRLSGSLIATVQELMRSIFWSFWQSRDPFPSVALDAYNERVLRDLGFQ